MLVVRAAHTQTDLPCATDALHQRALQQAADFQKHQQLEQEAYDFYSRHIVTGRGSQALTVPVVVHVIHDNGPENISDAAVQQAVQWLNEAFANAGYFDQGSGADAGIQFCLAQRTPDGQPTNGITRDQSTLTVFIAETQEGAMKNINRWKPKDYINIWVVRDICSTTYGCGIVAYAYYPSFHGSNIDGIVIEANFLNSASNVSVLAHEMGHYFGLYHTFEGGCTNNDCLLDGDRVCDTPPDQSTAAVPCDQAVNTCSTDAQSGFSTDQPDMLQNHMDYGHIDCKHDFTPGQADRMNYFLNGTRKSLLDSKGCLPPCPLPMLAAFTPGDTTINAGQTLFFDNTSQNAVIFSWTLNGVPFGGQQNASYLFDSAGVFTVQLVAQPLNVQLCEADSAQVTVQVVCPVIAGFTLDDLNPMEGETVFITNTSQNASHYEWFVNGISQGAVLVSLLLAEPGDYEIKLVASDNFCFNVRQLLVTVPPGDTCYGYNFIKTYDLQSPWNYLTGIQSSLDGNLYIASLFHDFNYLIKADQQGSVIWSKKLLTDAEEITDFATTEDNGVVVVTKSSLISANSSIIKLDTMGEVKWRKYLQTMSSNAKPFNCISRTADGGYIVGGYIAPNAAGPAQAGTYILKIDGSGNQQWAKLYNMLQVVKIIQLPNGHYLGVNKSGDANTFVLDSEGNLLWCKSLYTFGEPYTEVLPTTDGNYLLSTISTSYALCQSWKPGLAKITSEGEILWAKHYGVTPGLCFRSVVRSNFGGYFVVGSVSDQTFFAWLNEDGEVLKAIQFNAAADNIQFHDAVRVPGGYAISGVTPDGFDLLLAKTDEAGQTGGCTGEPFSIDYFPSDLTVDPAAPMMQPAPEMVTGQILTEDILLDDSLRCSFVCDTPTVHFELCNNNLDDDGDGLFDCLDPDCNCPEDVCAPRQANIWYFGDHAGLDFNMEPPTVLTDGQSDYEFPSAVACDANGRLLFYSDVKNVFNRFHQPMPNGTGLFGQGEDNESIIVPHPGDKGKFYSFISGRKSSSHSVRYSLIDMRLDNGRGDIVPGEKNVPITTSCERRIAAVRSCSFDGYWVLTHKLDAFSVFRIDQNGLNTIPVVSVVGSPGPEYSGQMKFSPSGKQIARTLSDQGVIELYDFDQTSGTISNAGLLTIKGIDNADPYGVEFSPTGRYLYVTTLGFENDTSHIIQFDLEAGSDFEIANSIAIIASKKFSPDNVSFANLHPAPNHKIYVANGDNDWGEFTNSISIIHNPDAPRFACQFQENALSLPPATGASIGLCNFISSYFAKPHISFPHDAPDTICQLNSDVLYQIKNVQCNVDSLAWRLEGLPGTMQLIGETANIIYLSPGEGRLIVTAYSNCGASADTLPIVVAQPFDKTLDLGPDRVVCDNGVFTFNAGSGFARYRWQNGSPDSVLTTLLPGQYWVEVWDACGNRQTDTVTVSIAPATVLDLGDDREGCDDLTASFERPDFFSRWQWTPADFISCDTCASVTVSPAATTSWVVVAQTDDGCISVDTLTFVIRDTLFFQLDTSVCSGQVIDLFGISLPADTTAHFFFPAEGPGCDTLLMVNVLGLDAPVSELEATVCPGAFFDFNGTLLPADTTAVFLFSAAGNVCDSVVTVTVSAWPSLTVALPPDTTLRVGATLVLNAETTGTGPFSFAWSPAGSLSCADCPDPLSAPLETTLYTLAATDANGCSAQDSVLVTVDRACVVVIPNAFTPNGDGVNDRFYPRTDPCVRAVRTWRVVSRWGEPVFERFNLPPDDPALGWDGNRPDGEPFPSDVLVWYVELEYYDGRKEVRNGDVALLR